MHRIKRPDDKDMQKALDYEYQNLRNPKHHQYSTIQHMMMYIKWASDYIKRKAKERS